MEISAQIAHEWLRRIVARYSPEFYRAMGIRTRYRNPETDKWVLFPSLPPEEQKKYYDRWKARQGRPQVRVPKKEFQRMREEAKGRDRGDDLEVEQAAAKADRKEMAQAIVQMKKRNVPARIIDKERRRLVQENESRRLKRKQERDKAFAESQKKVAARWLLGKVSVG